MKPDINKCIFVPNNTKTETTTKKDTALYTIIGYHDQLDENRYPILNKESKKVFAKSVTKNSNTKYYIKIGTYGRIFNPIGLFSEGRGSKFVSKIGKNEFEFKEVNKKIFDMYLNFLTTKNIAWLNNAEREMV